LAFFVISVLWNTGTKAQVATNYIWSQANETYTPLVAAPNTTPANIFAESWDDLVYSGYTLPFAFYYNGTTYPVGTVIGLDSDGWIAFNPGTMTGTFGGGSWVSTSNSNGMFLSGTANNNSFAGFNADLHYQDFATITGDLINGSNVITGIAGVEFNNIRIGSRIKGTNIPVGSVVIAIGANFITISSNALATAANTILTPFAGIFGQTIGTAPNRKFVIQWTQVKRYAVADNDNFSFQMILEEGGGLPSNQVLKVMYGNVSTNKTTNLSLQVGLRGTSNADFNARKSTTNWSATTAATVNTDTIVLKNTIVPASGLTYIWTPVCNSMTGAGAITGATNICPNSTQAYSLPVVPGATYYTWSYSGTGATFPATTLTPANSIVFSSLASGGVITVTPVNPCTSGTSATLSITVRAVSNATISYPSGGNYCSSNSPANVTITGVTGGTFTASPAGLTINASIGQVTPSTSSQGSYTVSYNYTSNTCSLIATTPVTIQPVVAPIATATPSTLCGSGTAQLQVSVASGSGYTVSPVVYNPLSSATPTVLWNTFTDDAMSAALPIPFSFSFYGQSTTQLYVSTNGHIQLQTSSGTALTPQTLPNAAAPNNIIALAWADLVVDPTTNPGSKIEYFTTGTSPNSVMVISYVNLRFLGGSGTRNVTGQVKLFESDSHIEVHIGTVNDNGSLYAKTLGIENSTGTSGVTPSGKNNVVWNVTTSEAWSFNSSSLSYLWSPSTNLNNATIFNPIASGLSANSNYSVLVTNTVTGCTGTASVSIPYYNTQLLSSNGNSLCGNGSLNLSATANAGSTISWYDAATGGSLVNTGTTFTTPTLSTTTTYYVSAGSQGPGVTNIGTGATTSFNYDGVFYHLFGGLQTQFLIRASELTSAGLTPGNITSLGIRFSSVTSQAYLNLAVSMLQTANADMAGGLNTGAFTNVYYHEDHWIAEFWSKQYHIKYK
jgi:hypothetical protein